MNTEYISVKVKFKSSCLNEEHPILNYVTAVGTTVKPELNVFYQFPNDSLSNCNISIKSQIKSHNKLLQAEVGRRRHADI